MRRRTRRNAIGVDFQFDISRLLRYFICLSCFMFILLHYLVVQLFTEEHISPAIFTRLNKDLPITLDLRPFPVCHSRDLNIKKLTSLYHQRYTEKHKPVCFLVQHIDGGPWWSYVSNEFAEILTHLHHIGTQSNILYRPFPKLGRFSHLVNLTRYFLDGCDMDESLPIEKQMPIIALIWDINHLLWHRVSVQMEEALMKTRLRLLVFVDDLHILTVAMARSRTYLFRNAVSEIFSTYPYLFHNYYSNVSSSKLTWLPHAASTLSYRTVNQSASNVLFVSGANIEDWYPCRARAFQLCHNKKDLVACLEHPGYGDTMKNDSSYYYGGRRYYTYMRKYRFGLGTCQSVQYAIAKLFELPANGLVLVTTDDLVPILQHLHLFEDEHFLTVDCDSPKALVNAIIRLQKMPNDTILQIRKRSQKLIHERHLTKHRAELLHVRLLSHALITTSTSEQERTQFEQWGRTCH